jgi:hypothetical protein
MRLPHYLHRTFGLIVKQSMKRWPTARKLRHLNLFPSRSRGTTGATVFGLWHILKNSTIIAKLNLCPSEEPWKWSLLYAEMSLSWQITNLLSLYTVNFWVSYEIQLKYNIMHSHVQNIMLLLCKKRWNANSWQYVVSCDTGWSDQSVFGARVYTVFCNIRLILHCESWHRGAARSDTRTILCKATSNLTSCPTPPATTYGQDKSANWPAQRGSDPHLSNKPAWPAQNLHTQKVIEAYI